MGEVCRLSNYFTHTNRTNFMFVFINIYSTVLLTSHHRYMLCDGSPDPTNAGEINAYISLWKEDETRVQVNEVLHDALLCLSVRTLFPLHFRTFATKFL